MIVDRNTFFIIISFYVFVVGITTNDPFHLSFLYEANDPFIVLPTFGTTVSLNAVFDQSVIQDAISRYNLEDNLIRVYILNDQDKL